MTAPDRFFGTPDTAVRQAERAAGQTPVRTQSPDVAERQRQRRLATVTPLATGITPTTGLPSLRSQLVDAAQRWELAIKYHHPHLDDTAMIRDMAQRIATVAPPDMDPMADLTPELAQAATFSEVLTRRMVRRLRGLTSDRSIDPLTFAGIDTIIARRGNILSAQELQGTQVAARQAWTRQKSRFHTFTVQDDLSGPAVLRATAGLGEAAPTTRDLMLEQVRTILTADPDTKVLIGDASYRERTGGIAESPADIIRKATARPGGFVWDGGTNLFMFFDTPDGGDQIRILLPPGTEIRSAPEAFAVLTAATNKVGGYIIDPQSTADAPAGEQTFRGRVWEGLGDMVRAVNPPGSGESYRREERLIAQLFSDPLDLSEAEAWLADHAPDDRQSDMVELGSFGKFRVPRFNLRGPEDPNSPYNKVLRRYEAAKGTVEAGSQVQVDAAVLAAISEQIDAGNGNDPYARGFGSISDVVAASQLLPDEVRQAFGTEHDTAKVQQLWDDIHTSELDQSGFQEGLQRYVLDPTLEMLDTWDRGVHSLFMTVLGGPTALVEAIVNPQHDQHGEAVGFLESFQRHYSELKEGKDRVSDFFNMKDKGWANLVDFTVSLGADPINVITPGYRAGVKFFAEALTDPAIITKAVRHPRMWNAAAKAIETNDRAYLHLFLGFADERHLVEMNKILRRTPPTSWRETVTRTNEMLDLMAKGSPAFGSPNLPRLGFPVQMRHQRQTLVRLIQNMDHMKPEHQRALATMLMPADSLRMVKLHPDDFLYEAEKVLHITAGGDKAAFNAGFDRMMDTLEEIHVTRQTYQAGLEANRQSLVESATAFRKATPGGIRRFAALDRLSRSLFNRQIRLEGKLGLLETKRGLDRGTTRFVEDVLDPGVAAEAELEAIRPALAERRLELQTGIREYAAAHDLSFDDVAQMVEEYKTVRKDLFGKIRRLEDRRNRILSRPDGKDQIIALYDEMYQDWGERVGLPKLDSPHPTLPGRKALDWTEVNKLGEPRLIDPTTSRNVSPFDVDTWNQPVADSAKAVKADELKTMHRLPASPAQLLLYEFGRNHKVLGNITEALKKSKISSGLKAVQKAWVLMVLSNGLSAVKGILDETLRFGGIAGPYQGIRSTLAAIAAPFRKGRTLLPGEVDAAIRESAFGLDATTTGFNTVTRKMKAHPQAAERFFNGFVLHEDQELFHRWAAYRRALGEAVDEEGRSEAFRAFERWWLEGDQGGPAGVTLYGPTLRNQKLEVRSAKVAIEEQERFIDDLTSMFKGPRAEEFRDRLVELAATNGKLDVATDGQLLRQAAPDIPGIILEPKGIFDHLMKAFWGDPAAGRMRVFYEWFDDLAKQVHDTAIATGRIKVLTVDDIMKYAKVSRTEALAMERRGVFNGKVNEMLREGWVLDSQLKSARRRFASDQADNIMYQLGSASMAGRVAQIPFPFGRAHFDFWEYWMRRLAEPQEFRIPFTNIHGVPAFTRPQIPALAAGKFVPKRQALVPVNVRLASRIRAMAEAFRSGRGPEGKDETPLTYFGDTLTFLPNHYDAHGFLQDVIPGLGPYGITMLRLANMAGGPELDTWAEVFASLDWQNRDANSFIEQMVDTFAPSQGRSLRPAAGHLLGAIGTLVEEHSGLSGEQFMRFGQNLLAVGRDPIGSKDRFRRDLAFALEENYGPHTEITTDSDSRYFHLTGDLMDRARKSATLEQAGRFYGRRMFGLDTIYSGERDYAELLTDKVARSGFIGEMHNAGWINDDTWRLLNQAVSEAAPVVKSPDSDGDITKILHLLTLFNNMFFEQLTPEQRAELITRHPGVGAIVTSSYEVARDQNGRPDVPDEIQKYVRGDGRLVLPTPELRSQGYKEGWLAPRDAEDMRMDAGYEVSQAHRDYIRNEYFRIIGPWLRDNDLPLGFSAPAEAAGETVLPIKAEWFDRQHWEKVGVHIPEDAFDADGNFHLTWAGLYDVFRTARDGHTPRPFDIGGDQPFGGLTQADQTVGIPPRRWKALFDRVPLTDMGDMLTDGAVIPMSFFGADLRDDFNDFSRILEQTFGWHNASEWQPMSTEAYRYVLWQAKYKQDGLPRLVADALDDPETSLKGLLNDDGLVDLWEGFRRRFRGAVNFNPLFSERDYNASVGWMMGPLDYTPFEPPLLTDLSADQWRIGLTAARNDGALDFLDGDTIRLTDQDGDHIDFRLIGINTPERGEEGYETAMLGLENIVRQASTVDVAMVDVERFGRTVTNLGIRDGAIVENERPLVVLYVDGVPLWDPAEFSAINITGARRGGEVPDYRRLLLQSARRLGLPLAGVPTQPVEPQPIGV